MPPVRSVFRWYFGWNIVAISSTLILLTTGLRLSIGPLFFPITEDLGFSRSLFSSIVALAMLTYGLSMPLAGWLVARMGTRRVLLAGTLIIFCSAWWTALSHSLLSFTLSFAVFLSIGLALASPVTLTPVLSRWFIRQRGTALFFLSTGGMAGLAVVTPLLTWSIEAFGWRTTLMGFAVVFTMLAMPGTWFLVRDQAPENGDLPERAAASPKARQKTFPKQQTAVRDLQVREALMTRPFWLVTIGLFANGFSMTLLGTHGVPMLMDHGFTAGTGSLAIGTIGLVAIFSTMILGHAADSVPRRFMLAAIYFVRGAAFVGLAAAVAQWQLYTVAVVGGLVWAGAMALASAIMADVYGTKILGVLYGLAYLGQQLAGMISSWLGGWAFEGFHTHWIAFGCTAVVLAAGGWASWHLPEGDFHATAPVKPA